MKINKKNDNKCSVICDDLTGAMDAGMQMAEVGMSVTVVLEIKNTNKAADISDVIMINTESRNISQYEAYKRIENTIHIIKEEKIKLIYKKIDSTLRGNIGIELNAVLNDYDMIAFVPALPYNGRTTKDGYHYINDKLLTETDLAKDPFSPITSSCISEIISRQSSAEISVIKLSEVRKGSHHVANLIKEMFGDKFKIIVFDCIAQSDLKDIYNALKLCDIKILPCGSAGMFEIMAEDIGSIRNEHIKSYKQDTCPILIVSGSPAEASKRQIEYAKRVGIEILYLKEYDNKEVEQVSRKAIEILNSGNDLIIDGAGESKATLLKQYSGDKALLEKKSHMVRYAISEICKNILNNAKINGIAIFGGDTTKSIIDTIGGWGIKIEGVVEPYISSGYICGGQFEGLLIISKAGGFGSDNIIEKIIKYI